MFFKLRLLCPFNTPKQIYSVYISIFIGIMSWLSAYPKFKEAS